MSQRKRDQGQRREGEDRAERELPAHGDQDAEREDQADGGDAGGDQGHLNQAAEGVDVAGKAGDDAAGLHLRELGQWQGEEALEESAAEADGDAGVERGGAPGAGGVEALLADEDGEDDAADAEELVEAVGRGAGGVDEDAVHDPLDAERPDHVEGGGGDGEEEDGQEAPAVGPEPGAVLAEVAAAGGFVGAGEFGGEPIALGLGGGVVSGSQEFAFALFRAGGLFHREDDLSWFCGAGRRSGRGIIRLDSLSGLPGPRQGQIKRLR